MGVPASAASSARLRSLNALARGLFPPLPHRASDARRAGQHTEAYLWEATVDHFPGAMEQVSEQIAKRLKPAEARDIGLLLWVLDTRLGTLLLVGTRALSWRCPFVLRFEEMSDAAKEDVLLSWASSPITQLRAAFRGLRLLIMKSIATWTDGTGSNPLWPAIGFPGPRAYAPAAMTREAAEADAAMDGAVTDLRHLVATAPSGGEGVRAALRARGFDVEADAADESVVVRADVVIVGSGAGGGVAAGVLAGAGLRVVVVEKGPWVPTRDMKRDEAESLETMFENAGLVLTEDLGMSIMAGACAGGGTRINWCASFRTPPHVRAEWAAQHGLPAFESVEYDDAMDAVCERLGVHTDVEHNGQNGALAAGLKALGLHGATIPRNCAAPRAGCQGLCTLGCAAGYKRDTATTFLADAARTGRMRMLTQAEATRVLTRRVASGGSGGRADEAYGVEICVAGSSGRGAVLQVHAERVVAAGGTLHSPALLLRSGIRCGGNVGAHLRLHPASMVFATFPERALEDGCREGPVRLWEGAMMTAFSKDGADWEGSGYGGLVSVPQVTTGIFAGLLPWHGAQQYREMLAAYPAASMALVYVRDSGEGRVDVDGDGQLRIRYWPNPRDADAIMQGMQLGMRALAAAGACSLATMHHGGRRVALRGPRDPTLQQYLDDVAAAGVRPNWLPLFSAHQMGTCRMGADPGTSVVDENGECHEVARLHVADASVFPTASGVNPMITAESISYMVAARLAQRMTGVKPAVAATNGQSAQRAGRMPVQVQYESGSSNG